jgi:hypothetical protein
MPDVFAARHNADHAVCLEKGDLHIFRPADAVLAKRAE